MQCFLNTVSNNLNSPTILACVNAGYVKSGLVENWYRSLERIDLHKKVIVFGLDEWAVQNLSSVGIPALLWDDHQFASIDTDALEYRTGAWRSIVFAKLELVRQVLLSGIDVLFSDVDIVFLRDPLPFLFRSRRSFWIQSDNSVSMKERHPTKGGHVCSGFYYAKPCQGNINGIAIDHKDTMRYEGEQDFLRDQIIAGKLDVSILPLRRFPNGRCWYSGGAHRPYIVHFNWIRGVEAKISRMKECGLWFIRP